MRSTTAFVLLRPHYYRSSSSIIKNAAVTTTTANRKRSLHSRHWVAYSSLRRWSDDDTQDVSSFHRCGCVRRRRGLSSFSTSSSSSKPLLPKQEQQQQHQQSQKILMTIEEIPIRQQDHDDAKTTTRTIYTLVNNATYNSSESKKWHKKESKTLKSNSSSKTTASKENLLYTNVITHFLPAQYPKSVADGYGRFAALSFAASVAGSAAMVLSTQTLLLAIGIVGSSSSSVTTSTSIMAGALNWVMKDGIGQLGGVWFASYMSRNNHVSHNNSWDANPKYWRIVSAMVLDVATLIEICAPIVSSSSSSVLLLACMANVGKNVGFLTASASRAALHQALVRNNNLGDITAKAGSQSMAASLCGTAVGIGFSYSVGGCGGETLLLQYYLGAFVGLSMMHEGCNYWALKAVPLSHLDRQRLDLILHAYMTDASSQPRQPKNVLTPSQVAAKESILWSKHQSEWLSVGTSMDQLLLKENAPLLDPTQHLQTHLIDDDDITTPTRHHYHIIPSQDDRLHLVFHDNAQDADLLRGMYHAFSLRYTSQNPEDDHAGFEHFLMELQKQGWNTTQQVSIESSDAVRIRIMTSATTIAAK